MLAGYLSQTILTQTAPTPAMSADWSIGWLLGGFVVLSNVVQALLNNYLSTRRHSDPESNSRASPEEKQRLIAGADASLKNLEMHNVKDDQGRPAWYCRVGFLTEPLRDIAVMLQGMDKSQQKIVSTLDAVQHRLERQDDRMKTHEEKMLKAYEAIADEQAKTSRLLDELLRSSKDLSGKFENLRDEIEAQAQG